MVRRLRDTEHLLRLAGLFAIGGGLFAIASLFMVPEGFGRYGHGHQQRQVDPGDR